MFTFCSRRPGKVCHLWVKMNNYHVIMKQLWSQFVADSVANTTQMGDDSVLSTQVHKKTPSWRKKEGRPKNGISYSGNLETMMWNVHLSRHPGFLMANQTSTVTKQFEAVTASGVIMMARHAIPAQPSNQSCSQTEKTTFQNIRSSSLQMHLHK